MIRASCLWLAAGAALSGCFGNGDPHHDHTLVRVDHEPQGANCRYGGTGIHTGVDSDKDSVLDDSEITSSQYICDAASTVKCDEGQTKVDGPVSLATAQDFTSLAGIQCIDGDLMIVGTQLASFPATPDLQIVTGNVIIAGNAPLFSLDGFTGLTQVGSKYIAQGNDSLVDIGAIGALTRFGSIAIVGNDALVDLSGLETFTEIDGGLQVSNNSSLTSLHGLENLTRGLHDGILFRSNKNLTSMTALSQLRSAILLEVSGNASLTTLPLASFERVDVYLKIEQNAALSNIQLPEFTTAGALFVTSNPALATLTVPELVLSGAVELVQDTSLASVSMPKLAYTTVNFDLNNLPQLATADFGALVAIGGPLYMYQLPQLASFAGFANLSSIGGNFTMRQCNAMTGFAGLGKLVDVANMTITQNAQLSSFTGLTSFAKVGGDLTIVENPNLPVGTSQAFASAITVVGSVTIN